MYEVLKLCLKNGVKMCLKILVYMREVLSGAEIMMFINHINDKIQLIEAIIRKL